MSSVRTLGEGGSRCSYGNPREALVPCLHANMHHKHDRRETKGSAKHLHRSLLAMLPVLVCCALDKSSHVRQGHAVSEEGTGYAFRDNVVGSRDVAAILEIIESLGNPKVVDCLHDLLGGKNRSTLEYITEPVLETSTDLDRFSLEERPPAIATANLSTNFRLSGSQGFFSIIIITNVSGLRPN